MDNETLGFLCTMIAIGLGVLAPAIFYAKRNINDISDIEDLMAIFFPLFISVTFIVGPCIYLLIVVIKTITGY